MVADGENIGTHFNEDTGLYGPFPQTIQIDKFSLAMPLERCDQGSKPR